MKFFLLLVVVFAAQDAASDSPPNSKTVADIPAPAPASQSESDTPTQPPFVIQMPTTELRKKTYLDVLDDAVKIGLGAMIAAIATYLAARVAAKLALDKEQLARRLALIEAVAKNIDDFHTTFMEYACSCPVAGLTDTCPIDDEMTRERLQVQSVERVNTTQLADKQERARRAATHLTAARSSLSLMGYSAALSALKKYKDSAEKLWLVTKDGTEPMDPAQFAELKTAVSSNHYKLFDTLSRVYPIGESGLKDG